VLLLAIESSCDDTSVAILKDGIPLSNVVSSQMVHENYGGVVPEMASREHQKNIVLVAQMALKQANAHKSQIDAIAFTRGPGLLGSLMVGISFAKGLSLGLNRPLIAVNHIEAHILSLLIDQRRPSFPFICLVVSGGHTMIVLVRDWNKMEVLGGTKDDAVGEAFDKCAKLLGLGYPGGKQIDDLAKTGNPNAFKFPVGQMPGYHFSYSGVKTSFLYFLREKGEGFASNNLNDICASLQFALLKPLLEKTALAMDEFSIQNLGMSGGVAANSALRSSLKDLSIKHNWNLYIPDFQYCTDNAAMIGRAAMFKWELQDFCGLNVSTEPRLKIGEVV